MHIPKYKTERRRRIYKILRIGGIADSLIAKREQEIRDEYEGGLGIDYAKDRVDGGEKVPTALRMLMALESDVKINALKRIRSEFRRIMAMRWMSKRERSVVERKCLHGKTLKQIASEDGMRYKYIKRLFIRAVDRINIRLDEYGYLPLEF